MPALTTLAAVRAALPRLASVADAEIERLIDEASDAVEAWTHRKFGQATYTETYTRDGSGRLFLNQRPIISIGSITVGVTGDSPTVLASDQYQFDPDTGEVRAAGGSNAYFPTSEGFDWPWPFSDAWRDCEVTYTAGYGTVPPAISGLVIRMVGRGSTGLTLDPAVKSKTWGKVSVSYDNSSASSGVLLSGDMAVLAPWRNYSL